MTFNIHNTVNNVSNVLSDLSAYPVTGTLAGGIKVTMGAIQTLTALACLIITAIPAACNEHRDLLRKSWGHFEQGTGNILMGIVESIPVVQTILRCVRMYNQSYRSDHRDAAL